MSMCFPHMRGDEPDYVSHYRYRLRFPHMRGDEPLERARSTGRQKVFPTCVGMNRERAFCEALSKSFSPHAWG